MEKTKLKLMEAINKSVQDLHKGMDMHRCLVANLLEQGEGDPDLQKLLNQCPSHTREERLTEALKEAIEVLEESRKSFKSKRLEMLRKKLTLVLIENK